MVHSSTHLAFCWHLEHVWEDTKVFDGSKEGERRRSKDGGGGGGSDEGFYKSNRRQKFREQGGPPREALQRSHIVSILRTIPVLRNVQVRFNSPWFESLRPVSFLNTISDLESMEKGCETSGGRCEDFAIDRNGGSALLGGESMHKDVFGMEMYKELPRDVLWPFSAISELEGDHCLAIDWDAMPAGADPMRGLGYKAPACDMERKLRGKKVKRSTKSHKVGRGHDYGVGDEEEGGLARGERKRSQVGSIATALKSFNLHAGSVVVDFGCGSGALSLPLACLFQDSTFVCVDYKQESIRLLNERAQAANLNNLTTWQGRIEDYTEPFDACVALHACGQATDLALVQALKWRASYVVSPCCIGKLQFAVPAPSSLYRHQYTTETPSSKRAIHNEFVFVDPPNFETSSLLKHNREAGMLSTIKSRSLQSERVESRAFVEQTLSIRIFESQEKISGPGSGNQSLTRMLGHPLDIDLVYPRSKWLRSVITPSDYVILARTADWSCYDHESWTSRLHSLCKVVVELDRNQASQERGYQTCLLSLLDQKAGAVGVGHVLVGKATT